MPLAMYLEYSNNAEVEQIDIYVVASQHGGTGFRDRGSELGVIEYTQTSLGVTDIESSSNRS